MRLGKRYLIEDWEVNGESDSENEIILEEWKSITAGDMIRVGNGILVKGVE